MPDAVISEAASIRRPHLHEEVFRRLAARILNGELAVGSALPAERLLADHFGVSRLLVRQAVHRLAEIGLCRVRQGGATIVEDPALAAHPTVGVLALELGTARVTSRKELFERQVLGAIPLLLLAEPRLSARDAGELRSAIDQHERSPEDLAAFEERFWVMIADIGGNSFYRRDTRFWFGVVRANPDLRHPTFGAPATRIAFYRALVDALEQKAGAPEKYLVMARTVLEMIASPPPRGSRSRARL